MKSDTVMNVPHKSRKESHSAESCSI